MQVVCIIWIKDSIFHLINISSSLFERDTNKYRYFAEASTYVIIRTSAAGWSSYIDHMFWRKTVKSVVM